MSRVYPASRPVTEGIGSRDAMVQVRHGMVRTSVFGPQFRFSFGTCFVRKENNFFLPKFSLYFACQQKL